MLDLTEAAQCESKVDHHHFAKVYLCIGTKFLTIYFKCPSQSLFDFLIMCNIPFSLISVSPLTLTINRLSHHSRILVFHQRLVEGFLPFNNSRCSTRINHNQYTRYLYFLYKWNNLLYSYKVDKVRNQMY